VPTSGVIDAGAPATGVPARTTVYFLADSRLHAVPRPTTGGGSPVAEAVRLLLRGPTPAEARTLSTTLPVTPDGVDIRADGDIVTVRFPPGVDRVDPRAMAQLTCTVATALGKRAAFPSADRRTTAPPALPEAPDGVSKYVGVRAVGTTWKTLGTDVACPVD
jgi:hypothetical protein